jgi:hypothetical protein
MPSTGDDVDRAEMLAAHADTNRDAWQQTLDDMGALEAEREGEGYDAVAVAAGHTAPKSRDAGDTDQYGLVHVVPGNVAEALASAYVEVAEPEYEVYRAATETRVFLVTELRDPDSGIAILVAGNYRRYDARGLVRTARETGRMFTHLQKLDGTHLGSFAHDDPEKFFPPADVSGAVTRARE